MERPSGAGAGVAAAASLAGGAPEETSASVAPSGVVTEDARVGSVSVRVNSSAKSVPPEETSASVAPSGVVTEDVRVDSEKSDETRNFMHDDAG